MGTATGTCRWFCRSWGCGGWRDWCATVAGRAPTTGDSVPDEGGQYLALVHGHARWFRPIVAVTCRCRPHGYGRGIRGVRPAAHRTRGWTSGGGHRYAPRPPPPPPPPPPRGAGRAWPDPAPAP